MQTWRYPSQRGLGDHVVTLGEAGVLVCTCKGWGIRRPGKPHECRHVRDVLATHGFTRVRRGDYVGVSARLTSPPVDDILIDRGIEETMATTATVLETMKASAMVDAKWSHLLTATGAVDAAKFDATFATGDWIMDEKLDGHRCLVRVATVTDAQGFEHKAVTTPLRSVPLPIHIVTELCLLPDGVYDGELLVPGGVSTDVPNLACRNELVYAVFDVLECNGVSTLLMPQAERRAILEMVLEFVPGHEAVALVAQFAPTWAAVQAVWARGGEGVILKRTTSVYRPGARSAEWLKVKRLEQHVVTVTGFEAGSFGPTAVVLFKFDDRTVGRCKNQDVEATAADPDAYIGRRLVIQCQQRMRGSKSPRHPMFDHWAGEGE